jgi:hypothetical protein
MGGSGGSGLPCSRVIAIIQADRHDLRGTTGASTFERVGPAAIRASASRRDVAVEPESTPSRSTA